MSRARLLLLLALTWACDAAPGSRAAGMRHDAAGVDTAGLRALAVPSDLQPGRELFAARCSGCHGEAALGSDQGPPLVHAVYEPGHHADAAFLLAVQRGVRAHHWSFGDMPAVAGVSRDETAEIVRYVRWLQREAGVY